MEEPKVRLETVEDIRKASKEMYARKDALTYLAADLEQVAALASRIGVNIQAIVNWIPESGYVTYEAERIRISGEIVRLYQSWFSSPFGEDYRGNNTRSVVQPNHDKVVEGTGNTAGTGPTERSDESLPITGQQVHGATEGLGRGSSGSDDVG